MMYGIASQGLRSVSQSLAYATFDPANKHADIALSAGNLAATKVTADALRSVRSTLGVSSGKHYFEFRLDVNGNDTPYARVGVGTSAVSLASFVGNNESGWGYYQGDGRRYTNNAGAFYGTAWTDNGDVIGVALDMDAGMVWFSKNGVWQGSGNPVDGTNPAFSGLTGTIYAYASPYRATGGFAHKFTANFGATAFAYAAPSGFRAGLYQ